MAEIHGEDWAELFAELTQTRFNDLGEGRSNALCVLVHNETKHVSADTPALLAPGACRGDGLSSCGSAVAECGGAMSR